MAISKHRKNHKQKVNSFKLKRKDSQNRMRKQFLQQLNELYKQKMNISEENQDTTTNEQ